jgi:putative membrane protein
MNIRNYDLKYIEKLNFACGTCRATHEAEVKKMVSYSPFICKTCFSSSCVVISIWPVGIKMLLIAQIFAAIVLLLHVYFVLLETVLYRSRGVKVFAIPPDQVEMRAAGMSNQGCYNGFLVAALALGFFCPDASIAKAFMYYGLICVVVAGVWGAATVSKKILYIQAVPAVIALAAFLMAR